MPVEQIFQGTTATRRNLYDYLDNLKNNNLVKKGDVVFF